MSHREQGAVVVGGVVGQLPVRAIRDAVRRVLAGERRNADVAITFLDPRRMRRLNADYKQHDYTTDVISFPLPLPDGRLTGDIYICPWQAAREARSRGIRVREELLRLVVHGTLHILGNEHPENEGRSQSPMWKKQERYVGMLT